MSLFKDQLTRDVENVFLNVDEFSEIHNIDGTDMKVIIDTNELIERQQSATAGDGIFSDHILIYVSVAEYGTKPKQGKLLVLDSKKTYRIVKCIDEGGIYSMELEANKN